ncbi:MAG: hypothetical protein GTO24_12500 [candidate division Zixibacteria bacterium]|nr:hypothetical protein [candidate division Zixibacteria bacterium]
MGIVKLIRPGYGTHFLRIVASIYPGYHATGSVGDVIVGGLHSLVDGAICGWILGWLYNMLTSKRSIP